MKELTKAEEQVMNFVWELRTAYLKDIVARYPDPKPAYTTVSTVVNVLVKKGFLGFETHGKSREYHAAVTKDRYTGHALKGMVKSFFGGSNQQFASFFTSQQSLDLEELEALKKLVDGQIERKKSSK